MSRSDFPPSYDESGLLPHPQPGAAHPSAPVPSYGFSPYGQPQPGAYPGAPYGQPSGPYPGPFPGGSFPGPFPAQPGMFPGQPGQPGQGYPPPMPPIIPPTIPMPDSGKFQSALNPKTQQHFIQYDHHCLPSSRKTYFMEVFFSFRL